MASPVPSVQGACPQLCELSLHLFPCRRLVHCLGSFEGLNEAEQGMPRKGALFNQASGLSVHVCVCVCVCVKGAPMGSHTLAEI